VSGSADDNWKPFLLVGCASELGSRLVLSLKKRSRIRLTALKGGLVLRHTAVRVRWITQCWWPRARAAYAHETGRRLSVTKELVQGLHLGSHRPAVSPGAWALAARAAQCLTDLVSLERIKLSVLGSPKLSASGSPPGTGGLFAPPDGALECGISTGWAFRIGTDPRRSLMNFGPLVVAASRKAGRPCCGQVRVLAMLSRRPVESPV
jgi:hypothetical protein